jgi:predicted pyridoxine 5'-phosphate oxidase superfamily flavin-nucleotide-binding protein
VAYGFLDIASTASVKAAQEANGSRAYFAEFKGRRTFNRFTAAEAAFIAARDSFYIATVSETGWPYVQHRGGPTGFLRVLDDRTLAFADFRGNRQYITLGNASANDRVALLLMDYPNRRRLKIYARSEARELTSDPALAEKSCLPITAASPSGSSSCIWKPSTGIARNTSRRDSRKPTSTRRSRRFAHGLRSLKPKTRCCAKNE